MLLKEQFLTTTNGQPPKTSGLFGGHKIQEIAKKADVKPPPAAGRAGFGFAKPKAKKVAAGFRGRPAPMMAGGIFAAPGGRAFAAPPAGGRNYRIIQIEKIYNCVLYEKFINELRRMIRKYPNKDINGIVKHLFHGCGQTDPKVIYEGEDGLDIRFSNAGAYGQGIYFANNSGYSLGYSHRKGNNMQMFVALVCTGDSVQQPPGQYRIPPLKKGSKTERFDSINNGQGGHFIVYDNVKVYPGYLITFAQ